MSYLPPSNSGFLPYWLMLVSATTLLSSLQSHISPTYPLRIYTSSPTQAPSAKPTAQVTALTSRLFGTWNLISAVVRLRAAYNIHSVDCYGLALATFLVAIAHFAGEVLVWRTARLGPGVGSALCVAGGTAGWMIVQWGGYVM